MTNPPNTLPEWQAYVSNLSGADLLSKAKAANSLSFVRRMEGEGMAPSDAMTIVRMFAAQLRAEGQELPSRYPGALADMGALLTPVALPEGTPVSESASDVAVRVARKAARSQKVR